MLSLPQPFDAITDHFGILMLLNQHANKGAYYLLSCLILMPRGNWMTLFSGDRKDYVWVPEDSQGIFSCLTPIAKANGKWRQQKDGLTGED